MFSGEVLTLLNAVTVDTNGAATAVRGGRYRYFAWSSAFGGGTAKLQWTPDNGVTWLDLVDAQNPTALTATGSTVVFLPPGQYRGILLGSTTPAALSIMLAAVGGP